MRLPLAVRTLFFAGALTLSACGRDATPLPSIPSAPPPAASASPSPPPPSSEVAAVRPPSDPPLAVKARVTAIELDLYNGCVLYEDGRVACWDRLGPADAEAAFVEGLPKVDRLHVGFHAACARTLAADGEEKALYCWGANQSGQLGRGKRSEREERPAKVTDTTGKPIVAEDFLVGGGHACVLDPKGDVTCFGSAVSGETGKKPAHDANGSWISIATPTVVFRGAVRLFGGDQTSCAVDREERLFCWGGQDGGYSGHGDTASPRLIKTPGKVLAMSFGSGHSCLLASDGSVHCRGWNPGGQLGAAGRPQKELDGLGAFNDDFEPEFVRVTELTRRYVSIAASRHETCAVSTEGDVTCIGTPEWVTSLSRRSARAGPTKRTGSCTFHDAPPPATYKPPRARASAGSGPGSGSGSSSLPPMPTRFTRARCVATPEADLTDVTVVASTMGRRCTVHRDGSVRCVGERHHEARPSIDDEPVLLPLPQ